MGSNSNACRSSIRYDFLRFLLLLLLLSVSFTTAEEGEEEEIQDSNQTARTFENTVEFELPTLEVQFICGYDFREGYNLDESFEGLYKQVIPELVQTKFHFLNRMNTVQDIPDNKWYLNDCNMTSSNVLATIRAQGYVLVNAPTNRTNVKHLFAEDTIRTYFETEVCTNMTDFRTHIEHHHSLYTKSSDEMEFHHMEHELILLCEDSSLVYYDEEAPDAGFMFFGFIVGFMMVGMVGSELQKYDRRPHPLGGRGGNGRRDYEEVTEQEVEMV